MPMVFTGCFRLSKGVLDGQALRNFMTRWEISFIDCGSLLKVDEDGWVDEENTHHRDLEAFFQDIEDPSSALEAAFENEDSFFHFGFLNTRSHRYALLNISDPALNRMESRMLDRSETILEFFADLYKTLGAESMVLGLEIDFATLVSFIDGNLEDVDVGYINTAVRACPKSQKLLRKEGGEDITVSGVDFVTRLFSGTDENIV